jgi:hypothetical protein
LRSGGRHDTPQAGACSSTDPVVFFKLQLVMLFEGIRAERMLIETASLSLPLH